MPHFKLQRTLVPFSTSCSGIETSTVDAFLLQVPHVDNLWLQICVNGFTLWQETSHFLIVGDSGATHAFLAKGIASVSVIHILLATSIRTRDLPEGLRREAAKTL